MRGTTNLPYLTSNIEGVDVGGRVMRCTAAAALKIGDVVYLSGTRTVDKSTTLANHKLVCGVVVGGTNTEMTASYNTADYGVITAADANEEVLVQYNGIVYVIVAAAIAVGLTVISDTVTAGRVKAATDLSAGNGTLAVSAPTIGTLDATIDAGAVAVTSSAANGAIATVTGAPGGGVLSGSVALAGDGIFRGIGKLLQASSAAADVRPCLLTLGA